MRSTPKAFIALALIPAALAFAGCGIIEQPEVYVKPLPSATTEAPLPTPEATPEDTIPEPTEITITDDSEFVSINLVDSLPTVDYNRDDFRTWTSIDGCSVRNLVLQRDLVETVVNDGCKVESGVLTDPYSGETVNFVAGRGTSNLVPIDHIVPLKYACLAGACSDAWTPAERVAFANDMDNLVATTQRENTVKSWYGPANYLPTQDACSYGTKFIDIIVKYELSMAQADYDAVQEACS